MNKNDHALLEAFVIDNPDLNLLESKLSNFNIFEAVGMTRQEIRHSYFLAFLLNPSEAHYLGDLFLKKFLIAALRSLETSPFSAIEIDIANLEDSEVKREYKNIDVLIYSPIEKIVIAIENKVDSGEHDDQLTRYTEIISTDFPGYRGFLIYLTKEGDKPSHFDWHPLSYEIVSQCIDEICVQHSAKMNVDIHSLMTHYSNLIKRHIMSDSEIAQLCRKIYKQHRQAIDLIYEHQPDFQLEIADFLQQLIQKNQEYNNIEKDDCVKRMIRFAPKEWDGLGFQKTCQKWTSTKRILLFQFLNDKEYLALGLFVGPGNEKLKQEIYQAVKDLKILGINQNPRIREKGWMELFDVQILSASDYEDGDLEEVKKKIRAFFEDFLSNDLQIIRETITDLKPTEALEASEVL